MEVENQKGEEKGSLFLIFCRGQQDIERKNRTAKDSGVGVGGGEEAEWILIRLQNIEVLALDCPGIRGISLNSLGTG